MSVRFLSRTNFSEVLINPNLSFVVERLAWSAIGGPMEAQVRISGSEADIWEMMDRLRCGIEISPDDVNLVWWGYVRRVEITIGNIKIAADLEYMANRIRVAYVLVDTTTGVLGERQTTDWLAHADSTGEYGNKEQQLTLSEGTAAQAAAYAESALGMLALPTPEHQFIDGKGGRVEAMLLCRGWWETLGWTYYSQAAGREVYDSTGTGLQKLGKGLTGTNISFGIDGSYYKILANDDSLLIFSAGERIFVSGSASNNGTFTVSSVRDTDEGSHLIVNEAVVNESAGASVTIQTNRKTAQSFQLGSAIGWLAAKVKMRVKRFGTPADNIKLELCANSSGSPGTVLASATLTGSTLAENLSWHEFTLNTRVSLATGTTYWLVISRTGAIAGDAYYVVDGNDDLGYSRGSCKVYSGSAWVGAVPDVDLLFIVTGEQETSDQIEDILTSAGQFIAGVELDAASGIWTSPYRDGERTAISYLEDLLLTGIDGGGRLLVSVDRNRKVRIYAEPESSAFDYRVNRRGRVRDALGNQVPKEQTPTGVWMRLEDVAPASAGASLAVDPARVFVEEVLYDLKSGKVHLRPRGMGRLTGLQGGLI